MSDGSAAAVRDLSQPEGADRNGSVISADVDWAELELEDGGPSISGGTLVGIQTSQTIYLGHVESEETLGNRQRLRVRVDHWLALQDVSSLQKLWSQEPSG
ncbi:MAG: hypothetical protein LAP61_20965 [Acidobacteriia bacterium]|nr:hypothetical protein [Terriglobia bacterium]